MSADGRGRARAGKWAAWGVAVVLALALCARYDSISEATVSENKGLQSKAEALQRAAARIPQAKSPLRRLAHLGAAREAPKLGGKDSQALYDVPSFTEERTRMHFPQAEAGWLDMAAAGQIGDDVKSDDEQGNLTSIITEWKTKAYAEKALARSEAEVAARDENYYEYNITKGVANHKLYGAPPAPAPAAAAKGPAPKLKGLAPQLAVARGKLSLAFRKPSLAHPLKAAHKLTQPARVRAEEQVMEQTMAHEMAAEQRIRMFRAQMKEALHVASMKLAHQEMGWKPRRGPAAERDAVRTQSLAGAEEGVGPENDHLGAVKKAEIVNTGRVGDAKTDGASLIRANQAPAPATIDEVNVAIASQKADGYSNGEGKPVEEIKLPEDDTTTTA